MKVDKSQADPDSKSDGQEMSSMEWQDMKQINFYLFLFFVDNFRYIRNMM